MDLMDQQAPEKLIMEVIELECKRQELLKSQLRSGTLQSLSESQLGHWLWNVKENQVVCNPRKAEEIGYALDYPLQPVSYQFFTEKVHPDEHAYVFEEMEALLNHKKEVWDVTYRIQAKNGEWKVYHDQGRVLSRDEERNPLFVYGLSEEITEEERKRQQLENKTKELSDRLNRDGVSGLLTRTAMMVQLARLISHAKNAESPLSIILFTPDGFDGHVNQYGFRFKEEFLTQTGEALQFLVKDKGIAGFYDKNMFFVIVEQSKEESKQLANILCNDLEKLLLSDPVLLEFSVGVAEYRLGESISNVIQRASERLMVAQKKIHTWVPVLEKGSSF